MLVPERRDHFSARSVYPDRLDLSEGRQELAKVCEIERARGGDHECNRGGGRASRRVTALRRARWTCACRRLGRDTGSGRRSGAGRGCCKPRGRGRARGRGCGRARARARKEVIQRHRPWWWRRRAWRAGRGHGSPGGDCPWGRGEPRRRSGARHGFSARVVLLLDRDEALQCVGLLEGLFEAAPRADAAGRQRALARETQPHRVAHDLALPRVRALAGRAQAAPQRGKHFEPTHSPRAALHSGAAAVSPAVTLL